jgi:hypothetical protein
MIIGGVAAVLLKKHESPQVPKRSWDRKRSLRLELTKSPHTGLDAIAVHNPTEYQRAVIREAVYGMQLLSEPRLVCDVSDYILVEFSGQKDAVQSFIDYVNRRLAES